MGLRTDIRRVPIRPPRRSLGACAQGGRHRLEELNLLRTPLLRHNKVFRAQVRNRIAAFVGDDDVDGDELCFRTECWRLLRLLLNGVGIAPDRSRQ